MRINLLTTELRTGGAEKCLTEIAIGLQQRGAKVHVMSLAPLPSSPRDRLVGRLQAAGVPIHSAEARVWWQFPRAVRRVRQWLAATEPQILQTFLFHANVVGAMACGPLGRLQKRPELVFGIRVAEHNRNRMRAESWAAKRAAKVVCVSRSVQSFIEQHWPPNLHSRLISITNGTTLPASETIPYEWAQAGISLPGKVILFLGRLHPQKGIDLLLAAAPEILRTSADTRLVIVGEGPLEGAVKAAVAENPPGTMAWLPWQPDVWPLYTSANLVLLPSRFEGMPNVVLEAMAAGRPVLASQVEGVEELLGPNAQQQSFPVGDQVSMIGKLQALLTASRGDELGALNRQRVLQHFTLEAMVTRYQQLYEQLVP